jgi:hypothetical protein
LDADEDADEDDDVASLTVEGILPSAKDEPHLEASVDMADEEAEVETLEVMAEALV